MTGPLVRVATREDLPRVLALVDEGTVDRTVAAPDGGSTASPGPRTLPVEPAHEAAFDAIERDPNHVCLVLEIDGLVVGHVQVSFLPGLSRGGARRGQLETMRVAATHRGRGLGGLLVERAVELCRGRGCALVQLTTDARREAARRFYEAHGFAASHRGMKRPL